MSMISENDNKDGMCMHRGRGVASFLIRTVDIHIEIHVEMTRGCIFPEHVHAWLYEYPPSPF